MAPDGCLSDLSADCLEKVSILARRGASTGYSSGKSLVLKRNCQTINLEEHYFNLSEHLLVCGVFQQNLPFMTWLHLYRAYRLLHWPSLYQLVQAMRQC
ncbi:hypothetical protein [Yoonia sp.]|uniref:hypothetical protein n=1 Tax=Yoonia sp. TaxID=2212373 RepID=UPI002E03FD94|nr:hypothetical protein [Yoonia sp.]